MSAPIYATAVVTGASSGFGEAIATRLAQAGYRLILLARRQERLDALAHRLSPLASCHVIACDLNDHATLKYALQNLPEAFREIDVLVNNAGLALGLEPAHLTDWDDWQKMIDTNCTALAYITHLLLPGMVERNRGHIINIGSSAGRYGYKGGNVYGATKAFVEHFSTHLKADLLGTNVRTTHIAPALAGGSEFSLIRFKGDAAKAEAVYDDTLPLQPENIAEAAYWALCQPAHVNVSTIELMPVCQAPGGLAVHRSPA